MMEMIFENYSLEVEHVRLSHCYEKVYTVVDNYAIKVYLHAFATTELDGDVTLTLTFDT
jgi:hypothetical protein